MIIVDILIQIRRKQNRITVMINDHNINVNGKQNRISAGSFACLPASNPHHLSMVVYVATDKQVIISRRAGEAVLRGAHVFVPGTLLHPYVLHSTGRAWVRAQKFPDGLCHCLKPFSFILTMLEATCRTTSQNTSSPQLYCHQNVVVPCYACLSLHSCTFSHRVQS